MTRRSGRVAVTGVGLISPLAASARGTFDATVEGRRAILPVTLFDVAGFRSRVAGTVQDLPPGPPDWSRADILAVAAASEAWAAAAVEDDAPTGVVIGGTTGSLFEAERDLFTEEPVEARAAAVRRMVGVPLCTMVERVVDSVVPRARRGATVCSACSSGANAIAHAAGWLRTGAVSRVLAGGADALCRMTFAGFNALQVMDREPCRPFDRSRAGMSLGEGAGFLVLETEEVALERGADVLAWLAGWAVGAEAHHITQPEESGETAARLMRVALDRASLAPANIAYINAHGTGTLPNDAAETRAIRRVFGAAARDVRVASAKGNFGHALGASGAIEAALTVVTVAEGVVAPTAGLAVPAPDCDLRHVVGAAEPAEVRAALTSSFGFGGAGTVLVFEHASAPRRAARDRTSRSVVVSAVCSAGPLGIQSAAGSRGYVRGEPPAPSSAARDLLSELDVKRSRRFDEQTALATLVAQRAVADASASPAECGLSIGVAYGNVDRTVSFLETLRDKGPSRVPPAIFPHLVSSAVSGNVSTYVGLRGPVWSTGQGRASGESACQMAIEQIEAGEAGAFVAGAAEGHDASIDAVSTSPRMAGAAVVLLEAEQSVRSRGARPLARVAGHWQIRARAGARLEAPRPRNPGRAAVIVGHGSSKLDELLQASAWAPVDRRSVTPRVGNHEAAGAFAWAAAIALLAEGAAAETLVCGAAGSWIYVVRLLAVE